MGLSPMRYRGYTWPHNPRVYTIEYEREVVQHKIPFGRYHLQDLGRTKRVMRGEGEFVGANAYEEFGKLATIFYETGVGLLIHPLWQAADAYFVSLKLEQEPRPDYVRYSFVFWESVTDDYVVASNSASTDIVDSVEKEIVHLVKRGDTLWHIAKKYGTSVAKILALNPYIKNPNLIQIGDEVRIQ